jgi:hypothetical protein
LLELTRIRLSIGNKINKIIAQLQQQIKNYKFNSYSLFQAGKLELELSNLDQKLIEYYDNITQKKSQIFSLKDKCGKLVEGNIDKYFAFTMLTNDNRGNLTKDELKKILILSEHLEPPYKTDDKWSEEDKDEFGRKIIKNKFRILDNIYEEIINKK